MLSAAPQHGDPRGLRCAAEEGDAHDSGLAVAPDADRRHADPDGAVATDVDEGGGGARFPTRLVAGQGIDVSTTQPKLRSSVHGSSSRQPSAGDHSPQ